MRKSAIIIIMLVSIFTVFLGFNYMKKEIKPNVDTDATKFKDEYEKLNNIINSSNSKEYPKMEISSDNHVKYSSYDEIFKILEGGTGVIYFGFPECPWCRNAVPVLLDAVDESGIDTVYYLNIKEDRDIKSLNDKNEVITDKEGTLEYKQLLEKLSSVADDYIITNFDGIEYDTTEKRIYLPFVVFVKEGKIVGSHTSTVDSQKDPYKLLTDKEKSELLMIYINYMNIINGEVCDENC